MKIFSFHLKGKMAHFRKYYSNSSALSYFIPPRTTIVGILAGLLGRERDAYYDEFSLDKCQIALASYAPIKKCMQKLNLLMIKDYKDFNGSAEYPSQTPTEFVIPYSLQEGCIDYHIWVTHKDNEVMSELEHIITKDFPGYFSKGIAVALGTAFNLGWLEDGCIIEGIEKRETSIEAIESVVPAKKCHEVVLDQIDDGQYRLIKEEVPLEFDRKRNITPQGLGDMIINLNGKPIRARVDSFTKLEDGKSIMWIE